jgi:uncharacterized lipoprotein YddW (UPF0748 family)
MNQPNQETQKTNQEKIRGVWICSRFNSLHKDKDKDPVLKSKKTIIEALDFLKTHNFNYVFPAVWNHGVTAFPSEEMGKFSGELMRKWTNAKNKVVAQDKFYKDGFDPLETIIAEGIERNIKVIPWLEYGFMASAKPDGDHIFKKNPTWAAEWSDPNSKKEKVIPDTHAWMNSLNEQVQNFMRDLILEIVESYPGIAGIQGDDHFPAMPMYTGYDTKTQEDYKTKHGKYPPLSPKYPSKPKEDPDWQNWVEFRANKLTEYLTTLSTEVKGKAKKVREQEIENENLKKKKQNEDSKLTEKELAEIEKKIENLKSDFIVSMAPSPFPYGLDKLMQNSDAWVKKNIVHLLHPQLYKSSVDDYKKEVDRITKIFTKEQLKKFAPGIAFNANGVNLTPAEIVKCVEYNHQKELGGEVFFYYDYLRENDDAMAKALSDFWKNNP